MGIASYLFRSIAFRTEAADSNDTSCSPLRPPKRIPTRNFLFTNLVWTGKGPLVNRRNGSRRVHKGNHKWFAGNLRTAGGGVVSICVQHGTIVPFPRVLPKSTVLGTNPQSQVSYHGTQEPGVCPAFCRNLAILAVSAQRTSRGVSAAVHGIRVFRCREILGIRQCVATCSAECTSSRSTELDIRVQRITPSGLRDIFLKCQG